MLCESILEKQLSDIKGVSKIPREYPRYLINVSKVIVYILS